MVTKYLTRVTFPNRTEMFTLSDGVDVITNKLWDTPDEAKSAYNTIPREEYFKGPVLCIKDRPSDTAVVELEILVDGEWKDLPMWFAMASQTDKLIVVGPDYDQGR